ncbi:MAG: hypothetical protein NTW29_22485 [Bacteroidetes bacterium]|nr:hypothetical protein [Bacteroidota bacterium]
MKKLTVIAFLSAIVIILGCPSKKNTVGAPADCGCRNPADTNTVCQSFIDGRCGWCADKTCEQGDFCSYMPRDVDFLQKTDGYSTFIPACQNAFDWFSWQSFIAVNWPADANGDPLSVGLNDKPEAPRVWESYLTLPEVFDNAPRQSDGYMMLGAISKAADHMFDGSLDDLEPGSDKPLIDRNLNFTLYEIKVNKIEADYINKNGLTTWCGQKRFYDSVSTHVQFPSGSYKSDSVGAIEVKTGWRVLIPGVDDPTHFYTRKAVIVVDSKYVVTKVPIRDTVTVGLVAMHLIRNVSTKGSSWIWSSFEQVENAPDCPNGKCPPDTAWYSFYNPKCTTCSLNTAPVKTGDSYLWSVANGPNKQYGRLYATNGYGSQIGRINVVESSTDSISTLWRNKLKGINSVWQYYRLIGSQWLNAEDSRGPANTLGIPTAQANTAMESYLQIVKPATGSGSCMSCHGFATGKYDKLNADLSFVLKFARKDTLCSKQK